MSQQQQQQQSGQLQVQQGQPSLIHPPPPSTPKQRLLEKDLPAYRPSPDYETVMRRRMERMAQQHQHNLERLNNATNLANIARAQVYNQPETMAYSQPEMGVIQPQSVYVNGFVEINGMNVPNLTYRPVDRTNSLIIQPTYSTPELSSQGLSPNQMSTSENMITEALINQYRPPPPYRGNSNSTPDLAASQTPRSNLSNSPDLVSRRNINLSNAQLVDQSQFDQSVENLALEVHNLQLSQQMASNPRLTDESSRSSGHSGSFHKDFVYRTRSDSTQQPVLNADQMLMAQNHGNPQLAVFPGGQVDANNQQVLLHSHHQHVQPTGITTTNVQPQQVVTTVTTNNMQQQILQQPQTQLLQQNQANSMQQQLLQQTQTQTGANLTSAMVHHQVQQQNQQQQIHQQQQELLLQYQLQVQQQQQQLENQLLQQNLLHQTKPPPDYNEHMAQQQRQQQQQQQQLQQHHLQHSMPAPQSTPQQQHIQSTIQTPQTTAKQQHTQHVMQTAQFTPQQKITNDQPTRHSFSLQQASLDLHDTPLLQKLQQEQPQITVTHDPDYVNLMSVSLGIDNPNYNPNSGNTTATASLQSSGPSLSVLVPPAVSPSGSMQEENHYDTIDCLDSSKLPAGSSSPSSTSGVGDTSSIISHSKNSSLINHSKSSSLDTSYLSYTSSMTEEVSTRRFYT